MKPRIAVIEDDPDQSQQLRIALEAQGYRVATYRDRASGLAGLAEHPVDLVVLDIMLGDEADGGFLVCRELLSRRVDLPIVFLSSRSDEIDRVSGLRLGAWDYQTKPVSIPFLVERIASLFRIHDLRSSVGTQTERAPLRVDSLSLDEATTAVSWCGRPLRLTLTEFRLLLAIVESRATRGASYDALARATRQGVVENNTINTHIRHLRRKFLEIDPDFDRIRNVYGYGYRWGEA